MFRVLLDKFPVKRNEGGKPGKPCCLQRKVLGMQIGKVHLKQRYDARWPGHPRGKAESVLMLTRYQCGQEP